MQPTLLLVWLHQALLVWLHQALLVWLHQALPIHLSSISHTALLLMGSIPVVGSSSTSTEGRPSSASARLRRRRMPPL
jgi:hypothetical protein